VTNQDGMTKTNIVYLSDISKMIPATLEYILTKLPPTDILIVDTLGHDIHPVHFSLAQAQALSKQIKPRQHTYLIGMSCDSFPPHDEMNQRLANIKGLNMSLAHDGLVVEFKATK
jgi:phosphoribosyl 1,2-cyclic phosphodiesterase